MSGTRAVFVAGAGTEIGKTYVTAALTRRLRALGRGVRTLKPLASGVPPLDAADFAESDTGRLLAAQGLATTPETVAACSPWRFTAPLSPDLAADPRGPDPGPGRPRRLVPARDRGHAARHHVADRGGRRRDEPGDGGGDRP